MDGLAAPVSVPTPESDVRYLKLKPLQLPPQCCVFQEERL
jgi:hypothetical protein